MILILLNNSKQYFTIYKFIHKLCIKKTLMIKYEINSQTYIISHLFIYNYYNHISEVNPE
jgi:hypothetical protein